LFYDLGKVNFARKGEQIMLSINSTIREIAQAHKNKTIEDIVSQIRVHPNELRGVFKYLGFEYRSEYRKWSCIFTDNSTFEYLERSLKSVIEEMENNKNMIKRYDTVNLINKGNLEFTQDEIQALKQLAQQQIEKRMSGNISDESIAISKAVESISYDDTSKKMSVIQDSLIDEEIEESVASDIESEETDVNAVEGKEKYYFIKKYERNPRNRAVAIKIRGLNCYACGFNFQEVYGELGKGFIEVHHVVPLSSLKEEVVVNPETDLVPLCANCHRMIHRKKEEILSVDELKELIMKKKQ